MHAPAIRDIPQEMEGAAGAPPIPASQRLLLRHVARAGRIGRTELATRLGLSRASVSVLARELIDRGFLLESPRELESGPGRPATRLRLNPAGGLFLGVLIGQQPAQLALADLAGDVVAQASAILPTEPNEMAGALHAALPGLLAQAGATPARPRGNAQTSSIRGIAQSSSIRGIGLALSGLVDHATGICRQSAQLGWADVPLAPIVQARTGLNCWLENDANVVAAREHLFGAARGRDDAGIIVLGEAIGCAHIMHGALYRGHGGGAGEIAHCTSVPDGAPCRCGRRGCLDTIASGHAVATAARAAGLNPALLEDAAAAGNDAALAILHRAAHALGLAIAGLIQMNAPALVLVCDVDGALGTLSQAVLRRTVQAHVLPHLWNAIELRIDRADRGIWARGAAGIAALRFLEGADA